jgi:hypothetical protein
VSEIGVCEQVAVVINSFVCASSIIVFCPFDFQASAEVRIWKSCSKESQKGNYIYYILSIYIL